MLLQYNGIVHGRKVKIYKSGSSFALYINNNLVDEFASYMEAMGSILNIKENKQNGREEVKDNKEDKKAISKKSGRGKARKPIKDAESNDANDSRAVQEVAGDGTSDAKKEVTEIV